MRFAASLLSLIFLAGCMKTVTEKVVSPNGGIISTKEDFLNSGSQKLRAEKLVVKGEQLVSPISFFFADEIFAEALKADPNNRQAQFYRLMIAPMMRMKGLLSRLNYQADPGIRSFAEDLVIYRSAREGLFDFLNAPAKPMTSEFELQAIMNDLLNDQTRLSDFIKKNKTFLTHVSVPIAFKYPLLISECGVTKISEGTYRLSPCPYQTSISLAMNQGDWEALLQMVSGVRIATAFAISYNATGYFKYLDGDRNHHVFRTEKQIFDFVSTLPPEFGTLYRDHHMAEVLGMGSDIYGGARWLLSVQDQMCDYNKRVNHLFGWDSLCIKDIQGKNGYHFSAHNAVGVLGMSLAGVGGIFEFLEPHEGGASGKTFSTTNMDAMALFKNPVSDLKTLQPNQFDSCGQARDFADKTFGGTFRDGDAGDILLQPRFRSCAKN